MTAVAAPMERRTSGFRTAAAIQRPVRPAIAATHTARRRRLAHGKWPASAAAPGGSTGGFGVLVAGRIIIGTCPPAPVQEGHTAHATAEEAEADALKMIRVYEDFATNIAGMPVVVGRKSRIESFAGARKPAGMRAMAGAAGASAAAGRVADAWFVGLWRRVPPGTNPWQLRRGRARRRLHGGALQPPPHTQSHPSARCRAPRGCRRQRDLHH